MAYPVTTPSELSFPGLSWRGGLSQIPIIVDVLVAYWWTLGSAGISGIALHQHLLGRGEMTLVIHITAHDDPGTRAEALCLAVRVIFLKSIRGRLLLTSWAFSLGSSQTAKGSARLSCDSNKGTPRCRSRSRCDSRSCNGSVHRAAPGLF